MSESGLSHVAENVVNESGADAAVVIAAGEDASDIGAFVGETDGHPAELSLWMLALHIHHIRQTAHEAGGDVTVEGIVSDALSRLETAVEQGAGRDE